MNSRTFRVVYSIWKGLLLFLESHCELLHKRMLIWIKYHKKKARTDIYKSMALYFKICTQPIDYILDRNDKPVSDEVTSEFMSKQDRAHLQCIVAWCDVPFVDIWPFSQYVLFIFVHSNKTRWVSNKKHCQRHYGPRCWLLWPVILVW